MSSGVFPHRLPPSLGRRALSVVAWTAVAWLAWHLLDWAVLKAVFAADPAACRARGHEGACWGVIAAKWRPLLFGHYPYDAQWRPAVASMLLIVCTAAPLVWLVLQPARRPVSGLARASVLAFTSVSAALAIGLLYGGWQGLPVVSPARWGGLALTLVLSLVAWLLAWPLGIFLAYARRARAAWVSWPATTLIEVVRGAPLIIWLFAAAFAWPALLPEGLTPELPMRAVLVLAVFASVYLAEILRAGLQTVPAVQSESAAVLGLGWWATQRRIVLPQAIRFTLPPLVSHAIGLLKDTSLVMVIGLHELSGSLGLAIGGDAEWRPFYVEAYVFIAAVYAALCLAMARIGRRLEHRHAQPAV